MIRQAIAWGGLGMVGSALVLSELRWFSRIPLTDRLMPYQPGSHSSHRSGVLSVESFRDVVAPLCRLTGERLARTFGADEDPEVRLTRIHSDLDATAFRVRQMGSAAAAMVASVLIALWVGAGPVVSMLLVGGAPTAAFLGHEMALAAASARWQRRIFLELPVITEQLGMLLSAGWSLSGALGRISERGSGACARDLGRVRLRMQQGLTESEALREWAERADVTELTSLVAVLALNRETADLGRLIGEEARGVRREAHRRLIETIERRTQLVWIPVTVAALVPGVLLMAVPFVDALALFSQ